MEHKHSLKVGMTIVNATVEHRQFIAKLANALGIELSNDLTDMGFPNVYYSGVGISRCVHSNNIGKASCVLTSVTFQEFITAMVTPLKEESPREVPAWVDQQIKEYLAKTSNDAREFFERLSKIEWPTEVVSSDSIFKNFLKATREDLEEATKRDSEEASVRKVQLGEKTIKELLDEFKNTPLVWVSRNEESISNDLLKRISDLEAEVKALKGKDVVGEAQKEKPVVEDRRVNFGESVTFDIKTGGSMGAAIGKGLALPSDRNKVLIANKGYTFKIIEDYWEGRPAFEIHKL